MTYLIRINLAKTRKSRYAYVKTQLIFVFSCQTSTNQVTVSILRIETIMNLLYL